MYIAKPELQPMNVILQIPFLCLPHIKLAYDQREYRYKPNEISSAHKVLFEDRLHGYILHEMYANKLKLYSNYNHGYEDVFRNLSTIPELLYQK